MGTVTTIEALDLFRRAMAEIGLVVPDNLVPDGNIHRCGTEDDPRGQDGAYLMHLDDMPVLWCRNWKADESCTLAARSRDDMTPAERAALQKRWDDVRAQARQEETARHEEAARRAVELFDKCIPAQQEHPYLQQKQVPAMDMVKQTADGRLVIPLFDQEGRITSLQFIAAAADSQGKWQKRFLAGGRTKGCWFPLPQHPKQPRHVILICEGFATGISLFVATGYEVRIAFNAGNLLAVAQAARKGQPATTIVICADNDTKPGTDANIGIEKAREAAQAVQAILAWPPLCNGKATDFNDLARASGSEAVRAVIEKALESTPEPEEWEEPVPFEDYPLPELTRDMLPPLLGDFCFDLARSLQIPPELAFANAIGATATAAQACYEVQIKEGYKEPLNLYLVCPLKPGNRKTAAVKACSAPLIQWEKDTAKTLKAAIRQAEQHNRLFDVAIEAKQRAAAKASIEQLEEIQREIEDLEAQKVDVPVAPQLLVDNTTPEALAEVMENSMHNAVGMISAEGGIFDILAGMYSQGVPNLDLFLKAHCGEYFKINRKTGKRYTELDTPLLTVALSPQPSVLQNRSAARVFRGRGLDGRFLYLMPKSLVGKRDTDPPQMDSALYNRFTAKVLSLLPSATESQAPERVTLYLSPDALDVWLAFARDLEPELAEGGEFQYMQDWGAKQAGAVARIAGLFHLLSQDNPGSAITAETMAQAAKIGSFLAEHAKAAYDLMGADEETENARAVLSWIQRTLPESFSVRECHYALKNRAAFKRVAGVKAALKVLEERYYVKELLAARGAGAGRPSLAYAVNPAALTAAEQ